MSSQNYVTIDGNEAVARVAYLLNEIIAVYPISPATPMGEWADLWVTAAKRNIWGSIPAVVEMQSEGGAAGTIHGAVQTGALATTFTASQGLLLMLPNMFKIAGELTPCVLHVAARTVAAHALSIFGDHSDVMAARGTGFAMIAAASVQEAHDFALISQAATLASRIPFLHFFDGFRTSHEIAKIELLPDMVLRAMIDEPLVWEHRRRGLSPDHPVMRGSAQNPDVYFQAREAVNPFFAAAPGIVQRTMDRLAQLTGRQYHLFEYHGAPDAERVIVLMGSGCETAHETVDFLVARGEKVGVLKVRLYRPFASDAFAAALPSSVHSVAVLDRTKEPGSAGEPLYLDCVAALHEGKRKEVRVIGGRYGLASKEFTSAMVAGIFDHLGQSQLRDHFTIGIHDDVSGTSLAYDRAFDIEGDDVARAVFYGLGSDGTVGANRDSIKIIGERTGHFAQGYFVYDSKKAGAMTISHLRFGPRPIRSAYLIHQAKFVACHHALLLERIDVLELAAPHGMFLLNTPFAADRIWQRLPHAVQSAIRKKGLRFFVIDASSVASRCGLAGRVNTIMQVCFFAISKALPPDEAIAAIKQSIETSYREKGPEIVRQNMEAVDQALFHLHEVEVPAGSEEEPEARSPLAANAPPFVQNVLAPMMAGHGDVLPVSAFPCDGTFPTATSHWEKRNLATEVPVWEPDICVQCAKCVIVCPHAAIRAKVYEPGLLAQAPPTFKSDEARAPEWKGSKFTLQVAVEDCTGCGICVEVCPIRKKGEGGLKAIHMMAQPPLRESERANWNFFLGIPDVDRRRISTDHVRQQQLQRPLFEFSGACGGCGETPYLKLLTQLFGDRLLVANATGCSSIYGGNLPTTPWCVDAAGRGPAWSNSLFEDNAEFGFGFRVSLDKQRGSALELLPRLAPGLGDELARDILAAQQFDEAGIFEQRERIAELKRRLASLESDEASRLLAVADTLVRKSVWIVGGDGWAYDIGYGGLDHVLASGRNIKVLVLDTEVYSNTGGQCSKATPRAAVAKFAGAGKRTGKKDLGLMAMTYGNVYVGSVAMGARDEHTLRTFLEAESYDGPALIIAYSHCIAHGIHLADGMQHQRAAVASGQWLLYRFDPRRMERGENPLSLDSRAPSMRVAEYFRLEDRFRILERDHPDMAKTLLVQAQHDADRRYALYRDLAARPGEGARVPLDKPSSPK